MDNKRPSNEWSRFRVFFVCVSVAVLLCLCVIAVSPLSPPQQLLVAAAPPPHIDIITIIINASSVHRSKKKKEEKQAQLTDGAHLLVCSNLYLICSLLWLLLLAAGCGNGNSAGLIHFQLMIFSVCFCSLSRQYAKLYATHDTNVQRILNEWV